VRKTAAAAIAGGEIHQMADGRAGYLAALKAAASGDGVAFRTEGQVIVTKTSGVVCLDGGPAYWDHSANACTPLKPTGDRDFAIGVFVGDAASGDTTCTVNLNVEPRYKIDVARDGFTTALVANGTLTRFGGKHLLNFTTAAEAQKVDILSDDSFHLDANAIVEFAAAVVTNADADVADLNIGVANATHASDADAITESVFLHLDMGADLNIDAESDDGTTEVNATDTTVDFAVGTRFEGWIDMRDPSDVQIYVNGVLVLSGTTFDVSNATGPLKLLAHFEKSSNDSPGVVALHWLRCRTAEQ
jgi:hypothetical protein